MPSFTQTAVAGVLLCASSAALADPQIQAAAQQFLEQKAKAWLNSTLLVDAINAQNQQHATLDQSAIETLDQRWRAEVDNQSGELIDKVLTNPLSAYLRELKQQHEPVITELFVMDARGLNVGQSDVTSDYWQGDEAKWQKTFSVGPDAVFIDEVEMDESTQRFQTQISVAISDSATQQVIGAMTIGVDAEWLLMQ